MTTITKLTPRSMREAYPHFYGAVEHYKRPLNYFSVVAKLVVVGIIVFFVI